jgi:hypothetical protein
MTHTVIIGNQFTRERAKALIDRAPPGYVCSLKEPKRTLDQNARMWAMLTDISVAKPEGRTLTPDVWKALFLHSLDQTIRFEMALDGRGMVPVGFRSSHLSKARMSDLMTLIEEYGARYGVEWTNQEEAA